MLRSVVLLLSSTLLLSSCSHIFYSNAMPHTPLLKKKGDLQLAAGISAGEAGKSYDHSQLEFQGAYAINDKIGIIASYQRIYSTAKTLSEKTLFNSCGTAGIGYFSTIGKTPVIYEIYAGGGMGEVHNFFEHEWGSYSKLNVLQKDRYYKGFLQGNIGVKHKDFEIGLSSRFTYLSYYELEQYQTEGATAGVQFPYYREYDDKVYQNESYFFEPGIRMNLGRKVHYFVSASASFPLSRYNIDNYQMFNFATGLNFFINTRELKKKKE